jgi:phospholipid/cholesterol/gamma-HCH transport system ATP-binding protein
LRDAVIELERVALAFDRPILEDVSFAAFPGRDARHRRRVGTGKSTILKLILRLLQPDSGRVYVNGKDIAGLSFTEALEVRQQMGMVFQSAASVRLDDGVRERRVSAPRAYRPDRRRDRSPR